MRVARRRRAEADPDAGRGGVTRAASPGCAACRCPRSPPSRCLPATIGPTPAGVPVSNTSPGSSVMIAETNAIWAATSCTIWLVRPSWRTLAVDARDDAQIGGVEHRLDPRPERAERVVALGAGELHVGALLVAGGDVVGRGVAEHVPQCVLGRDVARRGADHHGQLALVVAPAPTTAGSRIASPSPMTDVDGLRKISGVVRRVAAHLLGVVGVVLADRHDLAGQERREQPDVGQRPAVAGEGQRAERVAVDRGDGQRVAVGLGRPFDRAPGDAGLLAWQSRDGRNGRCARLATLPVRRAAHRRTGRIRRGASVIIEG